MKRFNGHNGNGLNGHRTNGKARTLVPRVKNRIPEVLNEYEAKALLKQPNRRAITGLRDYCMIALMLNCGLRSQEVLDLETGDIDWNTGKLIVKHGKGNKQRVLWVSEADLSTLSKWRERKPVSPLLFTTLKGKFLWGSHLRQMTKRRALRAGIEKDVHPHMLRHTFATDIFKQSKNIRLVQKALGHSDLSTTMIYTHVFDAELESEMRNLRRETQGLKSQPTDQVIG